MTLGEKIRFLRTEKALTQPELAGRAGIEQSYLSKLENDKGAPSFEIISQIARALDLRAMELVNSLSPEYVMQNLSYLPEVAAEYELIRHRNRIRSRNHLVLSCLAMILGAGIAILGWHNVFFPERVYDYRSPGVISGNEPDNLFAFAFPRQSNATGNASRQQLEAVDSRLDIDYRISSIYLGKTFVQETAGGRRIYEEYSSRIIERRGNDLLLAAGVMLYLAGMFFLFHNIASKQSKSRYNHTNGVTK